MKNTFEMKFAARPLALFLLATLLLAGTALGEVSREGIVGEWHFDGDAKDSSGNGNDGTIYGDTFINYVRENALGLILIIGPESPQIFIKLQR
jgi:hypothetical protein